MDPGLEKSLHEAFAALEPRLRADSDELAFRLARRRSAMLSRTPPRAWCLAVRAADTRLTPAHIVMVPDAVDWPDPQNPRRRIRREHEVTLDARCLSWLCRPVYIPKPGLPLRELAKTLGLDRVQIVGAIKRGQLAVHHVKGLGGVRGRPVPICYTPKALDPAGLTSDRMNDFGYGTPWRYVSDDIPPTLSQTLLRRPTWKKDGRYAGWRWVCPSCHKETTIVYCPIPGPMASFVNTKLLGSPDAVETPPSTFACNACHGVHDYGRLDARGWNHLVSYLSGGLLFGHEVKRPEWWTPNRRYAPRNASPRHTKPATRTAQMTALLVDTDLTCREIALKLGKSMNYVYGWISYLYKRHKVHRRADLRALLRPPTAAANAAG